MDTEVGKYKKRTDSNKSKSKNKSKHQHHYKTCIIKYLLPCGNYYINLG